MSAPISLNVLEDFFESIEYLPEEINAKMQLLKEKEADIESLRKGVVKKRQAAIKLIQNMDNLSSGGRVTDLPKRENIEDLLHLLEEEYNKCTSLMSEKIQLENELKSTVHGYLAALDYELNKIDSSIINTDNDQTNPILNAAGIDKKYSDFKLGSQDDMNEKLSINALLANVNL